MPKATRRNYKAPDRRTFLGLLGGGLAAGGALLREAHAADDQTL